MKNMKRKQDAFTFVEVIVSMVILTLVIIGALEVLANHTLFLSKSKEVTIDNYKINSFVMQTEASLESLNESRKSLAEKQVELNTIKTSNTLENLEYKEFELFSGQMAGKYKCKIKGHYYDKALYSIRGRKLMAFSPSMRISLDYNKVPQISDISIKDITTYNASSDSGIPSIPNKHDIETDNPLYFYIQGSYFTDRLSLVSDNNTGTSSSFSGADNEYAWYITKKNDIFKPFFIVSKEGELIDHQAENVNQGVPVADDFQKINGAVTDHLVSSILMQDLRNRAIKHDIYLKASVKKKNLDPSVSVGIEPLETYKIYGINIPNTQNMINHLNAPMTYGMRRTTDEDVELSYLPNFLTIESRKVEQQGNVGDDYFKVLDSKKIGFNDGKDGFQFKANTSLDYYLKNTHGTEHSQLKNGYRTYCFVLDNLDNNSTGTIFTAFYQGGNYRLRLYKSGYNELIIQSGKHSGLSSKFSIHLNAKAGKNVLIITERLHHVHYSWNGASEKSKFTSHSNSSIFVDRTETFGKTRKYGQSAEFSLVEYASFYGNDLSKMYDLIDYFKLKYL